MGAAADRPCAPALHLPCARSDPSRRAGASGRAQLELCGAGVDVAQNGWTPRGCQHQQHHFWVHGCTASGLFFALRDANAAAESRCLLRRHLDCHLQLLFLLPAGGALSCCVAPCIFHTCLLGRPCAFAGRGLLAFQF
eukprot:355127-Chlamydomonas_euryale.AAC.9